MNSSQRQIDSRRTSSSYGQILKSTSLIGGAQAISLVFNMLRIKLTAILLGPMGVGLLGNFQGIQGLIAAFAGFGIQSSAVRDIVEAVSTNDVELLGAKALVIHRICWLTGLLSVICMFCFGQLLSQWTFNSTEYTNHVRLLGIAILLGNLSGGQLAIIQGMRRIGDLAIIQISSASIGTIISAILYKKIGVEGIIPGIVLTSFFQYLFSSHFTKKIKILPVKCTWEQSFVQAGGMARLGFVFMWNSIFVSLVLYLTRAWLTKDLGLTAVGIFGAAFGLSGILMNFILNAMGADYYPRLITFSEDFEGMSRLVNEQTEVGVLIAVPGLMLTIVLAPWLVQIFYSSEFLKAVDLIYWFSLGGLGRVVSWPLGFVLIALKKTKLYYLSETLANLVHLSLISIGLNYAGVTGVSIAFALLYIIYIIYTLMLCRHLIGFAWTNRTTRILIILVTMIVLQIAILKLISFQTATVASFILFLGTSLYCLRSLISQTQIDHPVIGFIAKIRLISWLLDLSSSRESS